MESPRHNPLPYRRLLAPHAQLTEGTTEPSRIGTQAKRKYALAAFQRTSFLVVLLTGAITSLYLMRLNQDIRQQASEPSSPLLSATSVSEPVFRSIRVIDPALFSQLASTGNTVSFVVLPDKLGYDPDAAQFIKNEAFFQGEEEVGRREFAWLDTQSTHQYSSTVWSFSNPVEAEKTYAAFNSKSNVSYLSTSQFQLLGVNPDQIMFFQTNDSDETLNFSFYLGNYFILLTAKNVPLSTASKNLETMATFLIEDLTVSNP